MNGQRIKHFRELHGYKREWLAEKLKINVSQVTRIENNQSQITVTRLFEIARLFKISILDLFEAEYVKLMDAKNAKKYGAVESNFIRHLLNENELLQAKHDELYRTNLQLADNLQSLTSYFKKLMDHLLQEKVSKKTKLR